MGGGLNYRILTFVMQLVTGVRDEATLELLNNPRNRLHGSGGGGAFMLFGMGGNR